MLKKSLFVPNKTEYLATLQAAIILQHSCLASHLETVYISESIQKKKVWNGKVELFKLIGHKTAKTCYAWTHSLANGQPKIIVVLGNSAIVSARKAVQAAIFMDVQPVLTRELEQFRSRLRVAEKNSGQAEINPENLNVWLQSGKDIKANIRPPAD
jgi:hypothetical protein